MWPRDAYVGQKVVCINNECWRTTLPWPYDRLPRINEILTISEIDICRRFTDRGNIKFQFNEITGWYGCNRFRPLEENKKSTETGMTILRDILKTTKIKEDV